MSTTAKRLMRGAGGGGPKNYIEDVFSTYLYTGNRTIRTITNGIDLAGKGGLVWTKGRSARYHNLEDTVRGPGYSLWTNTTGTGYNYTDAITAFGSTGYTLGGDNTGDQVNASIDYASWTFRKQPKFFDIVTWTGDGTNNRLINHSLGSTPGAIIIKRTSSTSNWVFYHRSLFGYGLFLNTTAAEVSANSDDGFVSNTTDTQFRVTYGATSADNVNASGNTYVAYLFAHNAGGFGLTGNDNVISCGTFTASASETATVTLGYEPQWLLFKPTSTTGNWQIVDNMRRWPVGTDAVSLKPNLSDAEANFGAIFPTATGFAATSNLTANATYIYIAIRRGPMKVPTVGTSVFSPQVQTPSGGANNDMASNSNFPIDWLPTKQKNTVVNWYQTSRLTQNYMSPNTTAAEGTYSYGFDRMSGVGGGSSGWNTNSTVSFAFRRAPGFFDVVAYTGNGGSNTINHNLGVEPELIIFKSRSATENWVVLSDFGPIYFRRAYLDLTNTGPQFGYGDAIINSKPSATSISLLSGTGTNSNAATYVAYLFATCPGVSKVGTYTGNGGSSQDINCGFTSSARFVLVKAVSGTGDWWVWDTERGITSGNDSSLRVNTTDTEVTTLDFINPLASGFTVVGSDSSRNGDGIKYIFLAIA